jgi:hypothetical protein
VTEGITATDNIRAFLGYFTRVNEFVTIVDESSARYLWNPVDDSQTGVWQAVDDAQGGIWTPVDDAQPSNWVEINPNDDKRYS